MAPCMSWTKFCLSLCLNHTLHFMASIVKFGQLGSVKAARHPLPCSPGMTAFGATPTSQVHGGAGFKNPRTPPTPDCSPLTVMALGTELALRLTVLCGHEGARLAWTALCGLILITVGTDMGTCGRRAQRGVKAEGTAPPWSLRPLVEEAPRNRVSVPRAVPSLPPVSWERSGPIPAPCVQELGPDSPWANRYPAAQKRAVQSGHRSPPDTCRCGGVDPRRTPGAASSGALDIQHRCPPGPNPARAT